MVFKEQAAPFVKSWALLIAVFYRRRCYCSLAASPLHSHPVADIIAASVFLLLFLLPVIFVLLTLVNAHYLNVQAQILCRR